MLEQGSLESVSSYRSVRIESWRFPSSSNRRVDGQVKQVGAADDGDGRRDRVLWTQKFKGSKGGGTIPHSDKEKAVWLVWMVQSASAQVIWLTLASQKLARGGWWMVDG